MSEENVETFKRLATRAGTTFDADAIVADMDPAVEWHPAMPALLGGEGVVYRGHEGVRALMRDFADAFTEAHMEFSEIRDLGDQVLALGHLRVIGKQSGVETKSPLAYIVKFKSGKATHVRAFLDQDEALEAAGVSE